MEVFVYLMVFRDEKYYTNPNSRSGDSLHQNQILYNAHI